LRSSGLLQLSDKAKPKLRTTCHNQVQVSGIIQTTAGVVMALWRFPRKRDKSLPRKKTAQ
jgi:hypothetical protein